MADGLWLCGAATSQPFVLDLSGHWRAAGHVVTVVPIEGPVTAIVDTEDLQTPPVADMLVACDDPINLHGLRHVG